MGARNSSFESQENVLGSALSISGNAAEMEKPPLTPAKKRLRALDAFRGLSLVVMVFVNYGGGKYWFFHHSPWNGLTVADLVFPWFIWIMGVSMAMSVRSLLRKSVSKRRIMWKIVKRSAILFFLGIVLNTAHHNNDLTKLRIPGVLQRFGISYLVACSLHLLFARPQDKMVGSGWTTKVRDILLYWPEWLVMLALLAVHLALTFFFNVPDCGRGYLGPGGLHLNGSHFNCTGGAAGYIDRTLLGGSHIYQAATPRLLEAKFQPLLRVSLCPLLEKADSQNHLVSQTACTALLCVSRSCGYGSISELIRQNADYIADSLLFKLKHASRHPEVPHIVQALTKHSSCDAIGLIQDVGYEVLNALDFCHNENALPFLRTLGCIVLYVNRWFPPEPKQNQPSLEDTPKREPSFAEFVEDFHRCKQVSENLEDSEEPADAEEDVPEDAGQTEKPEAPGHVRLLVQVLRRCIHLQSSSNIWVQTAVLSIICHAVVPVSGCEDEVLPMVHLLWKPLVNRFQGDNCTLSIKAFETLTSLVDASGDFIRQRTLKEVWPKLAAFLVSQHSVSRNKGKAYEITAAFKYQLVLLRGLGPLSRKLKIDEKDIALLASVVVPYMDLSQPKELQSEVLVEHLFMALPRLAASRN
ncbi:TELO2-interacting protein 1 homolog isoform X2 [Ixodes scapularis]